MPITSVGQQPAVAYAAKTAAPKPAAPPKPAPEQDTVILSEKAKDLAAKKSGKAVEEEMKESIAAKNREQQQKQ